MSNLRPNSVIACLDSPNHVQAVLDASVWASKRLQAPLGLLHVSPHVSRKSAVDYSGCLLGNDDFQLLNQFTCEEQDGNCKLHKPGRLLLEKAGTYCQKKKGRLKQTIYPLHRHGSIAESLDYVDEISQLVVIGHEVTCKSTLSQLIRMSKCPVLVVHTPFFKLKSALFAFDNSKTCHALLNWLCESSLARNMTIHVVMIGKDNSNNKDAVREAYARLKQAGMTCKQALIEGRDITASLLHYQKKNNLDLLMTGAFGESRFREFLYGSDTQKLLGATKTPYLLFPKD